jgi:hypothetical protein
MFNFDDEYLNKLNARYGKGQFLKAVVFTESTSPLVKKYWVDHQQEIVFQGHTYERLHMKWQNIKASSGMALEGANISVSNLARKAEDYVETLDIKGNEVLIQLLHLSLLDTLTAFYQRLFRVMAVRADAMSITFTVGRDLGRGHQLPAQVMLKEDYPGLIDNPLRLL